MIIIYSLCILMLFNVNVGANDFQLACSADDTFQLYLDGEEVCIPPNTDICNTSAFTQPNGSQYCYYRSTGFGYCPDITRCNYQNVETFDVTSVFSANSVLAINVINFYTSRINSPYLPYNDTDFSSFIMELTTNNTEDDNSNSSLVCQLDWYCTNTISETDTTLEWTNPDYNDSFWTPALNVGYNNGSIGFDDQVYVNRNNRKITYYYFYRNGPLPYLSETSNWWTFDTRDIYYNGGFMCRTVIPNDPGCPCLKIPKVYKLNGDISNQCDVITREHTYSIPDTYQIDDKQDVIEIPGDLSLTKETELIIKLGFPSNRTTTPFIHVNGEFNIFEAKLIIDLQNIKSTQSSVNLTLVTFQRSPTNFSSVEIVNVNECDSVSSQKVNYDKTSIGMLINMMDSNAEQCDESFSDGGDGDEIPTEALIGIIVGSVAGGILIVVLIVAITFVAMAITIHRQRKTLLRVN